MELRRMWRRLSRTVRICLIVGVCLSGFTYVLHSGVMPVFWQWSDSAPRGLWVRMPLYGERPVFESGQWVTACVGAVLPMMMRAGEVGRWARARGCVPVVKRVWLDRRDGSWVVGSSDGSVIRRSSDGAELRMVDGVHGLVWGDGPVWLYSDHPRSFDSRYFGGVSPYEVDGRAWPVWRFE